MIKIDLDHQVQVRQRVQANYLLLKNQIAELHAKNVQISTMLKALIEKGTRLRNKCIAAYKR